MQSHLLAVSKLLQITYLIINSKIYNIVEKQIYSYDEAYEESLRYFQGDELAARVWVNKYAVKDSFGNIYEKSPEDMHWRIANEIARVESKYPNALSAKELYDLLDHFKYIVPQGSPMTGIGMIIRLPPYPTVLLLVLTVLPIHTEQSSKSMKNKYN